jgi:hypothetical protein
MPPGLISYKFFLAIHGGLSCGELGEGDSKYLRGFGELSSHVCFSSIQSKEVYFQPYMQTVGVQERGCKKRRII